MHAVTIKLAILGALVASTGSMAQTMPAQPGITTVPPVTSPSVPNRAPTAVAPATSRTPSTTTGVVEAGMLEAGANSFTESQAMGRFEAAGFTNIQGLTKDAAGFWRGRGSRSGAVTDIAMDFQGRIAAGAGVMTLGNSTRTTAPMAAPARDGTPGNPPGTAAGRAMDRATGTPPATTTPTR